MAKVSRISARTARILPPQGAAFRLKLNAAYQGREDGFLGLDVIPSEAVDHIVSSYHSLPIEDGVVDTVFAAFLFHRLDRDHRMLFMNEMYRVLKPGAQLILHMPHWSSMRSITDPLTEWPPLCESSFMLYSKQWREQEKMTNLPLVCDFGGSYGYGTTLDSDIAVRSDEVQQGARKYWLNANLDLHITLTAQK